MIGFENEILRATSHVTASALRQPWEVGFAGLVLAKEMPYCDGLLSDITIQSSGPLPPWPEAVVAGPATKRARLDSQLLEGPSFLHSVRKLKDAPWTMSNDAARSRALNRWKVILEAAPLVFGATRKLLKDAASSLTATDLQSNLEDLFAKKASGTISKRAGSLLRFLEWFAKSDQTGSAFPVGEQLAYEYVSSLRSGKASASSADSFLSALRFGKYVLEMDIGDDVLTSGRLLGASYTLQLTKRRLKQRDELEVQQIRALEFMTCHAVSVEDQVGAGFFCFEGYGRARFGDAQHVERLIPDFDEDGFGYVEGRCGRNKTGVSAAQRTAFLPIVAVAHGVGPEAWGPAWIKAREEAGLPLEIGKGNPLMPAPGLDGKWCKRPLTSGEARRWMEALIVQGGGTVSTTANIGTHSLKRMCLTWVAKAGVDAQLRRTLGYHVASDEQSMNLYARDAQAGAIRALCEVVHKIRDGLFNPDSTRSGRFSKEAAVVAQAVAEEPAGPLHVEWESASEAEEVISCGLCSVVLTDGNVAGQCGQCNAKGCRLCLKVAAGRCQLCREADDAFGPAMPSATSDNSDAEEVSSDETHSSVDSGSEVSVSDLDAELAVDEMAVKFSGPTRPIRPASNPSTRIFQHKANTTLHFLKDGKDFESVQRLACGRELHAGYREVHDGTANFPWPWCTQCKGRN